MQAEVTWHLAALTAVIGNRPYVKEELDAQLKDKLDKARAAS